MQGHVLALYVFTRDRAKGQQEALSAWPIESLKAILFQNVFNFIWLVLHPIGFVFDLRVASRCLCRSRYIVKLGQGEWHDRFGNPERTITTLLSCMNRFVSQCFINIKGHIMAGGLNVLGADSYPLASVSISKEVLVAADARIFCKPVLRLLQNAKNCF